MELTTIRKWHGYMGVLIAPSVLFFALTGSVQLFGLHEAHDSYEPPAVLEKLASLHKDQEIEQPKAPAETSAAEAPGAAGAAAEQEHHHEKTLRPVSVYLLKWFFLLVALGLVTSTVFGIWMALQQPRRRRVSLALLAVGTIIPVLLVSI